MSFPRSRSYYLEAGGEVVKPCSEPPQRMVARSSRASMQRFFPENETDKDKSCVKNDFYC